MARSQTASEMTRPIIQFRPGELYPLLVQRAPEGTEALVAKRDLNRYYTLIANELRQMPPLTEVEACLIVDAMSGGIWLDERTSAYLWAEVADHIRLNDAAGKWDLTPAQGAALVQRLQTATPGQLHAIADACERFWASPQLNSLETAELLRRVGLLPQPSPRDGKPQRKEGSSS